MKRILIVEDDKATQDLYRVKLEAEGFEVMVSADGASAITSATQGKPDLIVLDLMLPGGMNGFDILNRLKQNPDTAAIKVVVLSNLSSEAETAKDLGVVDYLVKANTSIADVVTTVKRNLEAPAPTV